LHTDRGETYSLTMAIQKLEPSEAACAGRAVGGPFAVEAADPAGFTTARIQPLRHNFNGHPLMTLEALQDLAIRLSPLEQCRFIQPGTRQDSAFHHTSADPTGRSVVDVFNRIHDPGAWIALYNVEADPVYGRFVEEVMYDLRGIVEREEPDVYNVGGFIFISAPPSVTPFHIDRENNFWLQIRGRKVMNVWERTDRIAVPARAVDRFILHGALGDVKLKPEVVARSREFDVGPGDGVFFPSTSPHMTSSSRDWTRSGDDVSISIGVVFYTSVTRRRARAHVANLALRKLGLKPRHPGTDDWIDRVKAPMGNAIVRTLTAVRGFVPKPGF
jgi:hypothetical protein